VGDRYLLYYAASVFGKNTSVLGLATNPTLDPADPAYKWSDGGIVAQSGAGDQFNVIDPAILNDPADGLWLSFGSYWSGIKLIQLDPATGKRLTPDAPMYPLAHAHDIEASYIYRHGAYYYLFVNWGVCCRGVNSTYNIRIGRSRKVTGPYLDKNGVDMLIGGGTLLVGTDGPFVGPGHAGIIMANGKEWLSMHFYDGSRGGMSALAIRPVSWDGEGWPVVGMG
jgi:arabinan endo-1,5-alpha-L-arabinosidase